MNSFRTFLQEEHREEERKDVTKTLGKIPSSHASLVNGFKWKFHAGNTLNGDDQHVGYVDDETKEIAVAAPWNYGREHTILHEIAHRVYERLPEQIRHQWAQVVSQIDKSDESLNQSPEELFCHFYAARYSKNPPAKFYKKAPFEFIDNLPQ